MSGTILRVAVPTPLTRVFDYRLPEGLDTPQPGARVCVPFGRSEVIAVVLSIETRSDLPKDKLRDIKSVLDQDALLDAKTLSLLAWASRYYVYPIGEVIATALPARFRQAEPAVLPEETYYAAVASADIAALKRAKRQMQVMQYLLDHQAPVCEAEVVAVAANNRAAINALLDKGMITSLSKPWLPPCGIAEQEPPELSDEQDTAVKAVLNASKRFQPFLLFGVTGSGKTEVYLRLIERMASEGRQSLVIVPEISLTPQLLMRFQKRLACTIVSLHSGLHDRQRAMHWLAAVKGQADVVIGTRSAVFTPLPKLGLIVIDEEHDASLKQQDRFRYHARDLALVRARDANVPIVLGSATPSFESLHNARRERYHELRLTVRAGNASPPKIGLLDVRRRKMADGISEVLVAEIRRHLDAGGQALVFINRRGYAPVLICADCGATADCRRCDAHMTVHAASHRLRCHHCGAERPIPETCESCGSSDFDWVGQGTERIEQALSAALEGARIIRIDRDTTRRKGALESHLAAAHAGEADIMVGTQMLAKGHHFPGVTMVGILDVDRGLFGSDFRAIEQLGQLVTQVAGRAGRAERPGEVLIQTRNPDHPLLGRLIREGYRAFAEHALEERRDALLPPYSHVALVRAESTHANTGRAFLKGLVEQVRLYPEEVVPRHAVMMFGPVVAPMERVGGRYRYQLLLQANQRNYLNQLLLTIRHQLEADKHARKVRWSIDVDPVDFF